MAKALATWKVLPHGPLEQLSPSILTVVGELSMPLTKFERRMTVVRLRDRRLIIYSAIALDETQMRVLEDFGTVAFMVVPNHLHRNDAAIWKTRYPQMIVVAPRGAKKAVEEVVPVDTTEPDFGDPSVRFIPVAGTQERDCVLECEDDSGITLITNDIIGHMPHGSGWFLRFIGFAGHKPQVPRVVRLAVVKDKRALRSQLEAWATPKLARIVMSHGQTIADDPARALRDMAAAL
jgi:hypothetical protein